MVLGLCSCFKGMEWKGMVVWGWFVGFLAFITFVNWDYQIRYLFQVMSACYFFGLYAINNIYNWTQKRMAGKSYFSALRNIILMALLVWPVMNLVGEVRFLMSGFYSNLIPSQIIAKLKELSTG